MTTTKQTAGDLADEQAHAQQIPGRQFSFKLDGLVIPRDTNTTALDTATIVELVEVTDYNYPETSKT